MVSCFRLMSSCRLNGFWSVSSALHAPGLSWHSAEAIIGTVPKSFNTVEPIARQSGWGALDPDRRAATIADP